MSIAPCTLPAFNTTRLLTDEHRPADGYYWMNALKDYTQVTNVYSPTKHFLLTCLIHNYKKQPITSSNSDIEISFAEFRRIDGPDTIVHYIKRCSLNNAIYFISKTSLSGRQIAMIAATINEDPDITFTEETTTSLYLQPDKSHPVRVFKLITKEPETITYFVLGTNHMLQNVYYTCLALTPKWFPSILDGIEANRKLALVKLYQAIGHMDHTEYDTEMRNCINLCYEPEENLIDYSPIVNLLQTDINKQIEEIQRLITSYRQSADEHLSLYQNKLTDIQAQQRKLTALLTEPKTDSDTIINDAKSCKSIVNYYVTPEHAHRLTIKSKMILDTKAIVTKILAPENHTAHIHYHITSERARKLLEELWIKDTLQLYFCTTFHKSPNTSIPTSIIRPKHTRATKNTIPNPHLLYYTCYGSHKSVLIDAATANNLQYYLGVLTACNSNLNTGDATVLKRFCSDLFSEYKDKPILYDIENKVYITPTERMLSYETL
jgi:hypothetical protein